MWLMLALQQKLDAVMLCQEDIFKIQALIGNLFFPILYFIESKNAISCSFSMLIILQQHKNESVKSYKIAK